MSNDMSGQGPLAPKSQGLINRKVGTLGSGYQEVIDLYFDLPTTQTKNLSIVWSRGGSQVEIPVDTSGEQPSAHTH